MVDAREAEAISGLPGGCRSAHCYTVLTWLKLCATGTAENRAEVSVSDLEIASRARLSPNTVAKAADELHRAELISVKRRRGAVPVYRFRYPPDAIGTGRKRSSENGELLGQEEAAPSSEIGEQVPTDWGTATQNLSTRSPNSEQGTEKRARRFAPALASVEQGGEPAPIGDPSCATCQGSGFAPSGPETGGALRMCACHPAVARSRQARSSQAKGRQ